MRKVGRQRGLPGFGRMQRYPFTFVLCLVSCCHVAQVPPDVGKTIRSHRIISCISSSQSPEPPERDREAIAKQEADRKTGTTGPAPCLDLNPRRAAGSGRYRLRQPGTRSIRRRISWRGMGWPYPSARPFCPGTSSDGCCSGWSDGTLGGNGRPSATAHHCCMYQRFLFRHRRLSIRIGGRGGGRDRDHRPR